MPGKRGRKSSEEVFRSMGGRPETRMKGKKEETIWNFGILPPGPGIEEMIQAKPTLYSKFPHMRGAWDGKSTVNHYLVVQDVLKEQGVDPLDLIQAQPRGTCGGRAGSTGAEILQCILIAKGMRAKFKRVSHAGIYYAARKLYNMLNGNWQSDDSDGVAGGSVPEAMAKIGMVHREEIGDDKWYGAGSDDLACQLGAGMYRDLASKLEELAKDNIVTDWAPVKSAQELADGLANGGVGIGSDMQGFTTVRDNEGCCKPQGTWAHYHVRCSINVLKSGRKAFGYWQSWGKNNPQGPVFEGHPSNCFGVDWSVQDKLCKNYEWAVVFGFPLWDIQEGSIDIPWIWKRGSK
jgi:hypothetical protein